MGFFAPIRNFFKNLFRFGIQGAVLVGVSYTFRFISDWAVGGLNQIFLQIVLMSTVLFFMDRILSVMFGDNIPFQPETEEGMRNYPRRNLRFPL